MKKTETKKQNFSTHATLKLFSKMRKSIVENTTSQILQIIQNSQSGSKHSKNKIVSGIDFVTRALEIAIQYDDFDILSHQADWGANRLPHDDFSFSDISKGFSTLRKVLSETLPEQHLPVLLKYLDFLNNEYNKSSQQMFKKKIEIENKINDLDQLAIDFRLTLLEGNRKSAADLVLNAYQNGISITDIYQNVFQDSLRKIGDLWENGQISVAHEHFFSAATQQIMSMFYPMIFSKDKQNGNKFLSACIEGELHEIGMRMVTDIFELNGWDTYYLGASSPISSILEIIEEQSPDLVGLSATMYFNIPKVQTIIERVRRLDCKKIVKVIVGGYPFIISNNLWKETGADGFAQNAFEAMLLGNRLINHEELSHE